MKRCSCLLFVTLCLTLVLLFLPSTVSSSLATDWTLPASSGGSPAVGTAPAGTVNVRDFGAKGDVVMRTGSGAVTAGSQAFTDATNGDFTSDDVGKLIIIDGAGTAPHATWFRTTIASVQSTTDITLSDAAGTTVTNANYRYGSDDTAALQRAAEAATNGTLVIPAGNYGWSYRIDLGPAVHPADGVTYSMTVNGAGMDQTILTFMGVFPDWSPHVPYDPIDDKTQCLTIGRWGTSRSDKHADGVTVRDLAVWLPPCRQIYTDYSFGIWGLYADHVLVERCKVSGGDAKGIGPATATTSPSRTAT